MKLNNLLDLLNLKKYWIRPTFTMINPVHPQLLKQIDYQCRWIRLYKPNITDGQAQIILSKLISGTIFDKEGDMISITPSELSDAYEEVSEYEEDGLPEGMKL